MLDKLHILALLQLQGVGKKTAKRFLDLYGEQTYSDIDELWCDLDRFIGSKRNLHHIVKTSLTEALERAESIRNKCFDLNINIMGYFDPEFPNQYKNIPNPPLILFTKGNISVVNKNLCIAVIGTRRPSEYSSKVSKTIAKILAENKIVVVSGLAIGCDSYAHLGCIQGGGKTIAILANGLDTIYPKSNERLSLDILDAEGCLLSEYPPATQPLNNYFVERDRLISGLSAGIIVIETDIKGGTMHTVNFAQKQGRQIACIYHSGEKQNENLLGNNYLISKGAFSIGTQNELNQFIKRISPQQSDLELLPNKLNSNTEEQFKQLEFDIYSNDK